MSWLGQAVRLAGAPASTGTAVGRMPQPVAVARTAASTAAAAAVLRTFT
ncbi:hypothetical protein [Kitasatospora sp. HPMI-4]